MPKYRRRGVKTEHSVLPGALVLLQDLAAHPTVASVIPGRIRVTRGASVGLEVRLQAPTATGQKIAVRVGRAVQEVFVVARDANGLGDYLRSRFGKQPEGG